MQTKKLFKYLVRTFIVILILLVTAFITFNYWLLHYTKYNDSLYVTTSPQNDNWQGAFLQHGFLMSNTVTFLALPEGQKLDTEIIIGPVRFEDTNPRIYDVYWSADGTVIAIRTDCAQDNKDNMCFTYAYDFLEKKKYAPPDKWYKKEKYDLNNISLEIEKLLEQRGGKGEYVSAGDILYHKTAGKEKSQFKDILKKIRSDKEFSH